MKKNERTLATAALKSPFTPEKLQKFAAEVPEKAKIYIATFTPHGEGKSSSYLEARWWVPAKPAAQP